MRESSPCLKEWWRIAGSDAILYVAATATVGGEWTVRNSWEGLFLPLSETRQFLYAGFNDGATVQSFYLGQEKVANVSALECPAERLQSQRSSGPCAPHAGSN